MSDEACLTLLQPLALSAEKLRSARLYSSTRVSRCVAKAELKCDHAADVDEIPTP